MKRLSRMKYVCVLLLLQSLCMPYVQVMAINAGNANPNNAIIYDVNTDKMQLQMLLDNCIYELDQIRSKLEEKATEEEAPELYAKLRNLEYEAQNCLYMIQQISSEDEIHGCTNRLYALETAIADLAKEVETFGTETDKYHDGDLFSTQTENGVELTIQVISAENKTCLLKKATLRTSATTDITIPTVVNGLTMITIGDMAFRGSNGLTTISIPSSITSIGEYAFAECNDLVSVNIPPSVTEIKDFTFWKCIKLKDIAIPSSVTSIGKWSFAECKDIVTINLPSSLTKIGSFAFQHCTGLTTVSIPLAVNSMDGNPFHGCSSLISIIVDERNTKYDSRNNCNAIIDKAQKSLIAGCRSTIIPEGITCIGSYAFCDCEGLEDVKFPASLTKIDIGAFKNCSALASLSIPSAVRTIGSEAFLGCSGLTSIIVEDGNTNYDSRNNCNAIISTADNELLYGCKNTIIPNGVLSIGISCFEGCKTLTSIIIPESVTTIKMRAFAGCTGLTTILIPSSVVTIGYESFSNCSSLSSITIPSSVTEIRSLAFFGCDNLNKVISMISLPFAISTTTFYHYLYNNDDRYWKMGMIDATLYVPAGTKALYEATEGWNQFQNIVEMEDVVDDVCPDDNHPHMIDLGMPSGTKWACCNVGASNPEDYGGYYAWGETEEKEDYGFSTYIHCDGSSSTCHDIGADIAGTQYDVAHVKWGGSWRMPTFEQVKELLNNCTSEWTTVSGIKGCKFVGPNGNSIFIPSAGTRWDHDLLYVGEGLFCWSSTQNTAYTYCANELCCLTRDLGITTTLFSRYAGQSIRPVISSEQSIDPLEEDETVSFDEESGINEDADLAGNVIGNIFYNINQGDGGYNAYEGCITVTKPTADEEMQQLEGQDIFGEDFKDQFTGIVFKVPAGSGAVKITAETTGNMTLKVKVGNGAPIEMELEGKLKASFPYNVAEPTYVYIYAGQTAAGVKGLAPVTDAEGTLKIYGIELSLIEDGIEAMDDGQWTMDNVVIYNLSGQRLSKPQRGVNIINGKKIVVK